MSENKKHSLAKSAVLMGIIILFSKIAGLVRDMLVAGAFGTTDPAIAYETASKLPLEIFDFVLGGVVTSAFIPIYNSIAVGKGKKEALAFSQSYVNLILALTGSISVLGIIFARPLVSLVAPELSESVAAQAVVLTRIMFPMVIFVGLAFSFVGFLQSEGEYNIPAVISLVSNSIMIIYLIFFADKFGVTGLSIAMLVGWGAQAAVQIPAIIKRGFRYRLTAPLGTPEIAQAAKNTLPILIATWTTPVCTMINNRIASGIEGGRAITALGYSNKLYIIIVGLFSFVATNLLFPYFARSAAKGDSDESDRLMRTSIKILVFIIAPIAVGVAVLSKEFIALVYERGEFTHSDTLITAEAMRSYAVGMIFAAVGEVLTKAFFAVQKMKIPMISALISVAVNVTIILTFGKRLGIGGIALVSALSAALNMTLNYIFARRHKLISRSTHDILDVIKSVCCALVMGVAVWLVSRYFSGHGALVDFAAAVIAGVAVYALLALLLRSDEITGVFGAIKEKLKKQN